MVCGVLYVMTEQNNLITYNTNDMTLQSTMTSLKLPSNSFYNARDRILFGWKNNNPVYYMLDFGNLEFNKGKKNSLKLKL